MKARLALIFCLVSGSSAFAGFKDNYEQWKGLDSESQAVYVMGMLDAKMSDKAADEESWVTLRRDGINDCIVKTELTPGKMSEAVTKHYETYAEDADFAPSLVFDQVLQNICLDHINAQRETAGLEAWAAQEGSIKQLLGGQ